jgi:membrane protein implicated in regulation of membrane protease activity
MPAYVFWFIAAFALVAAELLTGTFYLLVIGVGAAAGGLAALAGAGFGAQLAATAAVSVIGIAVVKGMGLTRSRAGEAANLGFDTGQAVEVAEARPDGTLRVTYRGAQWDARLEGGGAAAVAGERLVIRATRGNLLVVARP